LSYSKHGRQFLSKRSGTKFGGARVPSSSEQEVKMPRPMGRPLKWGEPTEVLTVRVPASVKKRLTQEAERIKRPVAEVVVKALGYK
jgi:hypothetical protein